MQLHRLHRLKAGPVHYLHTSFVKALSKRQAQERWRNVSINGHDLKDEITIHNQQSSVAVPDEVFRGAEAQFFEGPHLFNKNQCRMVSP